MTLTRSTRLRAALLSGAVALLAACSDAPTVSTASSSAALTVSPSATLLACPSRTTRSSSAVIGPRGGRVGVAGSSLVVPPDAVREPTRFTFTLPASPILQVDVSAAGVEHFEFARPVAFTISYAHCSRSDIPDAPLGAWWVDTATLQPLGVMPASDDRRRHRVTFATDHLSGYAVIY